ncbi:MAG: hypothetical protein ACRCYP_03590 [Alphaproteobacteria bacterium]
MGAKKDRSQHCDRRTITVPPDLSQSYDKWLQANGMKFSTRLQQLMQLDMQVDLGNVYE